MCALALQIPTTNYYIYYGYNSFELLYSFQVEILTALKKLGEQLTADEISFLQNNSSDSMKQFEKVTGDIDTKKIKRLKLMTRYPATNSFTVISLDN